MGKRQQGVSAQGKGSQGTSLQPQQTKQSSKGSSQEPPEMSMKQRLFGNWTGKTPLSLLHEHCQRQGWNKPLLYTSKAKEGCYSCRVQLSKSPDKRSTTTLQVLIQSPKTPQYVWPSDQEAKHFMATYALHRVASHLSMKPLLPPSHRDFWVALELEKESITDARQREELYNPDPFSRLSGTGGTNNGGATSRPASSRGGSSSSLPVSSKENTSLASFKSNAPPSRKRKWPTVHLSESLRLEIEDLIKTLATPVLNPKETLSESKKTHASTSSSLSKGNVRQMKTLVEKGFREAHVQEAFLYANDMSSALHWLCIHVPEDDLPPSFRPSSSSSKLISMHRLDSEGLKREYALKRVLESGYGRQKCERILDQMDWDEHKALSALTRLNFESLFPNVKPEDLFKDKWHASYKEERDLEIDSLKAIYGDSFRESEEPTQGSLLSIKLSLLGSTQIDFYFPKDSKYPLEFPGLVLRNDSLPTYIRLSAVNGALKELEHRLGEPLVYTLVAWFEEHLENCVRNPPALMSLFSLLDAGKEDEDDEQEPSRKASRNGSVNRFKPLSKIQAKEWSDKLLKQFQELSLTKVFQKVSDFRAKLPVYSFKAHILDTLSTNQIILISGETGCGKSTQVGQYILEQELVSGRGAQCQILCTQPRRISAISLAQRVSYEQCQPTVGKLVGYKIRGESKYSPKETKLVFMTTGVILRMIQFDPHLQGVTHVIFDEVHERSMDGDLFLILLKNLSQLRPDLRIILMSATLNADTFSSYFGGVPVISVPGFTHPVQDFYLEDYVRDLGFTKEEYLATRPKSSKKLDDTGPWDPSDPSAHLASLLKESDRGFEVIYYDLIAKLVQMICQDPQNPEGAILIFLPGAAEIDRCAEKLKALQMDTPTQLKIFPLHANLSSQAQSQVFPSVPSSMRKVILSTNIAETSITIDDIVFVIDTGKVKELQYKNDLLSLVETWTSKASCKQRRGRAGRVRPGKCYKLFTRKFEGTQMAAHQIPEILRIPLEQLCLTVKGMGYTDARGFLGKALDAPSMVKIEKALEFLHKVNAIDSEGNMTALGRHMAALPMDLKVAKFLILGTVLGCLESTLTIAACMSSKPLFLNPPDRRDEAKVIQKNFSTGQSDWLTASKAYHEWVLIKSRKESYRFCEENMLSMTALREVKTSRDMYLDSLVELGYVDRNNLGSGSYNTNDSNLRVIKAALFAGLYPNLVTIKRPEQKFTETAHGNVAIDTEASDLKFYTDKERVFIHPSSVNSDTGKFEDSFLVYHNLIHTSKMYLRDTTCVSLWPALMFGGDLDVDFHHNVITMDTYFKFDAVPRISALTYGLRKLLDRELALKIEDPSRDVLNTPVGQIITKLFTSDGV